MSEEIHNIFQKIIRDSIRVKITPVVTQTLVAAFFLIYGLYAEKPFMTEQVILLFGFIPALMFNLYAIYRYVTHIFLHLNWLHLIFNSAFLWCFGDNVEERTGRAIYVISFFASGIFAAFCFGMLVITLFPDFAIIPCIGASGAISGIMGMYFMLIPENKIIFLDKYEVDSKYFLAAWFIEQLIYSLTLEQGIAYFAHVSGFILGVIIGYVIKRKEGE